MAGDNKSLARFILDGILPAGRGVPQIEVEFNIDANGILTVLARDKATEKEQNVTVQDASGLSEDEVEKMRNEADQHAAADAQKRQAVEAHNAADTLSYSAEKMLQDNAEKIEEVMKERVEAAIAEVRETLSSDDTERLVEVTEKLSAVMQEVGQAIYGQVDSNEASESGEDDTDPSVPPEGAMGEDASTVEGEFREV